MRNEIKAKVRECVKLAHEKFGFSVPYHRISVEFATKGQHAGKASCKRDRFTRELTDWRLQFSLEAAALDLEAFLNDTVPHEVAHLVCFDDPSLGRNHNDGWRRVDLALGGNGSRTHRDVLTKARYQAQYLYVMPSGREYKASAQMHKKLQRGQTRVFRNSREKMTAEHFVRVISPREHEREHQMKVAAHAAKKTGKDMSVAKPSQAAQKTASHIRRKRMVTGGGQSKLDACRAVFDPNRNRGDNIEAFMAVGCTKAGAGTYYAKIKKEMVV